MPVAPKKIIFYKLCNLIRAIKIWTKPKTKHRINLKMWTPYERLRSRNLFHIYFQREKNRQFKVSWTHLTLKWLRKRIPRYARACNRKTFYGDLRPFQRCVICDSRQLRINSSSASYRIGVKQRSTSTVTPLPLSILGASEEVLPKDGTSEKLLCRGISKEPIFDRIRAQPHVDSSTSVQLDLEVRYRCCTP